jgi:hypothetical protein
MTDARAPAQPAWTRVVPRCTDLGDFLMRWYAGEWDDPPPRRDDAIAPCWAGEQAPCQGTTELATAAGVARLSGPVTIVGEVGRGGVLRRRRGLPRYECCFCRHRWKIQRRSRRPKHCTKCRRQDFYLISET